jgi:activator of 2-hydroxyglutaryl-CoA dehydratase
LELLAKPEPVRTNDDSVSRHHHVATAAILPELTAVATRQHHVATAAILSEQTAIATRQHHVATGTMVSEETAVATHQHHVATAAILSEQSAVTAASLDSNKTIKNEDSKHKQPEFENDEWCQFLDTQVRL